MSATLFVDELREFIKKENLTLDQIYNADETGLFWRLLPNRILVCGDEAHADELAKERLTVLGCANAAGTHKCELLVIGKSAHPRAFKNVNHLPVTYKANKRAWVTQDIFLNWFNNNFATEERNHCKKMGLGDNCKILLLLDNCPAHPDDERLFKKRNIIVKYL